MWQPQGIYNEYVLRTPVILAGEEAVRGLYNYPAMRIAVIHGSSFMDHVLFARVFAKKALKFIERSWKGEPGFGGLSETLREIEEFRPDTIIAVGGGSVIDGAKLCRLLFEIPYFVPGLTVDGGLLKTNFIAVPTTVGSGAEVSSAAVYTENKHKEMAVLHELLPSVTVYDKRYVEHTPKRQLCASALDAMAHILEGYVSLIHNSVTDILAEKGLSLLRTELEKAVNDGEIDYGRLQYAGYIGGMVQNHCIVGAAHAVAHQLVSYGVSHGEAVALLLPTVLRMNAEDGKTAEKYERIAGCAGFENAEQMAAFIEKTGADSGIAERKCELKELLFCCAGMDASGISFRENVRADRGGKGNPREMTDAYITELIRRI